MATPRTSTCITDDADKTRKDTLALEDRIMPDVRECRFPHQILIIYILHYPIYTGSSNTKPEGSYCGRPDSSVTKKCVW